MKRIIPLILLLVLFASCNNYYKAVVTNNPAKAETIATFKKTDKYFILHNGQQYFSMNSVNLSQDGQVIECNLAELPKDHQLHLSNGRNGKRKYKKDSEWSNEALVLNEVHIYINDTALEKGQYNLQLEKIMKTEIIQKDKAKSSRSHIIGFLSGTLIAVGAIATLVTFNSAIIFTF